MKPGIHPQVNPVVFVDSSNGAEFVTVSTLRSDKTKKIGGVEHFVISVDISSASHPFYTGKKSLIDTAGRVDKFQARMKAAEKLKVDYQKTQQKKLDQQLESAEEKVTRKAQAKAEKSTEAAKPVKAKAEKKASAAADKPARKPAAKKSSKKEE